MTRTPNIAIYAIMTSHFMEFNVKNYKKQVANGEISKEWLDGYAYGIKKYGKAIIDKVATKLQKGQKVDEREKLRFYTIAVGGLIQANIEKLKKQVAKGEISKEWLDGYIRGAKEYEKELLNCNLTIL
jgi:hypothetical protein